MPLRSHPAPAALLLMGAALAASAHALDDGTAVTRSITSVSELEACIESADPRAVCELAPQAVRVDASLDGPGHVVSLDIPDNGPNMRIDVVCPPGSALIWNDTTDEAAGEDVDGNLARSDRFFFRIDSSRIGPGSHDNRMVWHDCRVLGRIGGHPDPPVGNQVSLFEVFVDAGIYPGDGEFEVVFLRPHFGPGGLTHPMASALVQDRAYRAPQDNRVEIRGGTIIGAQWLQAWSPAGTITAREVEFFGLESTRNTFLDGAGTGDPLQVAGGSMVLRNNRGRTMEAVVFSGVEGGELLSVGNVWGNLRCADGADCFGHRAGKIYDMNRGAGTLSVVGDRLVDVDPNLTILEVSDAPARLTLQLAEVDGCPHRLVDNREGGLPDRMQVRVPLPADCVPAEFLRHPLASDADSDGVIWTPREVRLYKDGAERIVAW